MRVCSCDPSQLQGPFTQYPRGVPVSYLMQIESKNSLLIETKAKHIRPHTNFTLHRGCKTKKLKNVSIRESTAPLHFTCRRVALSQGGVYPLCLVCAYYYPGSSTRQNQFYNIVLLHIITFARCGDSSHTYSNIHLGSLQSTASFLSCVEVDLSLQLARFETRAKPEGKYQKKKVPFYFRVQYTASCVYRKVDS